MDGIRAFWDGKQLLSRQGIPIAAPEEFIRNLPRDTLLDGELWTGRGSFEKLASLIKSNRRDWKDVQYCIFDVPSLQIPYSERMKELHTLALSPPVHLHPNVTCVRLDLSLIPFAKELLIY